YEQPSGYGTEQPGWYSQYGFDQQGSGQAYPQQGYDQYAGGSGQPGAFGAPATATMTYDDAMVKTAILLAVSIVAGAATMLFVPLDSAMMLAIPASLIAFAVGMFGA
ncbi:Bax inhibitor-1/YccA family protein, partial [Staphylococcus hominis]